MLAAGYTSVGYMEKTLQIIDGPSGMHGKLQCLQTGEIATTGEWCKAIAEKRGVSPDGIRVALCRAVRSGGKAYGCNWVRVDA